jgi:hypothetical protein
MSFGVRSCRLNAESKQNELTINYVDFYNGKRNKTACGLRGLRNGINQATKEIDADQGTDEESVSSKKENHFESVKTIWQLAKGCPSFFIMEEK